MVRSRHVATIEPYRGSGTYGPPFEVPGTYQGNQQIARALDGSETVAQGVFYTDPADIPAGSKITVQGYRQTWVVNVDTLDGNLGAYLKLLLGDRPVGGRSTRGST